MPDISKLATKAQVLTVAQRAAAAIAPAFKSISVSGSTVSFFTSTDGSGTAAATFDFPEEIFLDQAGTNLVENFAWSAATYPGSTNPNLDGKTVLVLAVKGDKQTNPTTNYSFVNLEKLIDTYTAADNSITISGYTVAVKISADTGNQLELKNDGLFVGATKVANATEGNVPILESDGTLANSTIVGADIMFKVTTPTAGNIPTVQSDGTLANSVTPLADVLTKVTGATAGNVAIFASDGTIADSTVAIATDEEFNTELNAIFPVSGGGN